MDTINEMREKLRDKLPEKRFEHTLGVEYTCCALAMRYGTDMEKARVAGLLHDCAKHLSGIKLIKKCHKYNLPTSKEEQEFPELLHAKVGAYLAEYKYGIEDEEILSAIRWHTTGHPEMTLLEKIVYVADFIEPNRDQAPNLPKIRELAFQDLDQCLIEILGSTLTYLREKGGVIDPATNATYEYYKGGKA